MVWTVQNYFGPIEGQGIRVYCPNVYTVPASIDVLEAGGLSI